jgi:phage tail-like protein
MEQQRILRYLPENYQLAAADGRGVMRAMLAVMEGMHAPVDRVLRSLDSFFDPYRAPDPFVLLQATWLGLDRYFDWSGGSPGVGEARFPAGIDRLRLLIVEFPVLVRSRGTHQSLTRFLEVATGITGFIVEDGMQTGSAFHIVVHVPATAASLADLVRRIVAGERPAHATWEVRMIEDDPGDKKKE